MKATAGWSVMVATPSPCTTLSCYGGCRSLLCLFLASILPVVVSSSATESGVIGNFTNNHIGDKVRLRDGNTIPVVGLGVALTHSKTYDAVTWALEVGYRLIDTAAEESYGNEDQVGRAARDYYDSVNKTNDEDDVFLTTKLWDTDHGFYQTLDAFDASYEALNGLEKPGSTVVGRPVDLYLIHSPFGGRLVETWDALLYLQRKGYIKSIGVSNFGIPHLQLLRDNKRPLPVVNQIEMHPLVYKHRAELIAWCRQHDIHIQAYGSLMHGYDQWLHGRTFPPLRAIATKHQKTTAQILLRWALQHGFLIIPKSANRTRIVENSLLYDFHLSDDEMQQLDGWGDDVLLRSHNNSAEDGTDDVRHLYLEDWNWNPIDEAPVHGGRMDYWESNFDGVDAIYLANDDDVDGDDEDGRGTTYDLQDQELDEVDGTEL